ncbi:HD domain-containing protein [Fulvivirga ulvae]|uniref:HD domain-containing protein n=1 Tax=Fulvivirga ulvae TaxID=2904245 RepID=UPI001F309CB0|nr:HD domain-containing protein [Fulvivirga ulvae]UII29658.1 HD domain-containing protein [Fulvivirga ulvae]
MYQPLSDFLRDDKKVKKVLKSDILTKVEAYVRALFKEQQSNKLIFHNLGHTEMVVKACDEISQGMQLGKNDREALMIAAWFHDTGYLYTYSGHEEKSKNIARVFLSENNYPQSKINRVLNCISVTQLDAEPHNLIEKVICDADLYHLSCRNYFQLSKKLRKEWELIFETKVSDDQWHRQNLNFLHQHNYCTAYARTHLEKGKQVNIKKNIKALEGLRHGA